MSWDGKGGDGWEVDGGGWSALRLDGWALARSYLSPRRWPHLVSAPGG